MNNSKKSLEVRNEVINLIKEKFGIDFMYSFNDLYKVKNDFIVRRLKGYLYKRNEEDRYYYLKDSNINKIEEFNNLVLEIDNFVKELKFEGFEIRLKKVINCIDERDRNWYEERNNEFVSIKEFREIVMKNEKRLILSIKFKNI
jgi:hypothetical protein